MMLLNGNCCQRHLRSRLPHHDIAAHCRDQRIPRPDSHRKIEGGDHADDTQGMVLVVHAVAGALGVHRGPIELPGLQQHPQGRPQTGNRSGRIAVGRAFGNRGPGPRSGRQIRPAGPREVGDSGKASRAGSPELTACAPLWRWWSAAECPLGIVYATDAAASPKVKVVGVFPADSYPPVVYPAALVKGKETPAARRLLEFLKIPEAKSIFEKHGFTVK